MIHKFARLLLLSIALLPAAIIIIVFAGLPSLLYLAIDSMYDELPLEVSVCAYFGLILLWLFFLAYITGGALTIK